MSFHLRKTASLAAPTEAPAPRARRLRRRKFILFYLLFAPIWIGIALLLSQLGLLTDKVSFWTVLFSVVTMVLMVTIALWNSYVGCPKCGANIYLNKDQTFMAMRIPSHCPKCEFDLETLPSRSDQTSQAT